MSEYQDQICWDIDELLTYEGEGEDTSISMSLEDIAEEMGLEEYEVRDALYASGTLDDRFYHERGLYSRC